MNRIRTGEFCTIERTPGRILLRIRHEPALLPGALTPRRDGSRILSGFAREVASRINEARSSNKDQRKGDRFIFDLRRK